MSTQGRSLSMFVGIPYVGPVYKIDLTKPWFKLKEWSDEYDGFFQMKMMGDDHLWIGDSKISHDLIAKRASIYSSRPPIPAIPKADDGFMYLPLMGLGGVFEPDCVIPRKLTKYRPMAETTQIRPYSTHCRAEPTVSWIRRIRGQAFPLESHSKTRRLLFACREIYCTNVKQIGLRHTKTIPVIH